jgi:tripartite-type tricarboxylate transporter receptor subunit TctC
VRIIIGFGAGASADTPARLLAQKFSDALGQQFIVENKPGAGSNVAADYVARAPNDGYTIFMATAAQTNYAGMEIIGGTSADFARYIDAEVKKATEVATAANIRQ